jgi:hypothetical protein
MFVQTCEETFALYLESATYSSAVGNTLKYRPYRLNNKCSLLMIKLLSDVHLCWCSSVCVLQTAAESIACLNCNVQSHIACLAKSFLQQKRQADQLLPIEGQCVQCDVELLWGDLVRYKRGCYRSRLNACGVIHVQNWNVSLLKTLLYSGCSLILKTWKVMELQRSQGKSGNIEIVRNKSGKSTFCYFFKQYDYLGISKDTQVTRINSIFYFIRDCHGRWNYIVPFFICVACSSCHIVKKYTAES